MSKDNRLAARELPRLGRFVSKALQQRRESLWGQAVKSMYSDKTKKLWRERSLKARGQTKVRG